MKTISKYVVACVFTGALALVAVTPSQARQLHHTAHHKVTPHDYGYGYEPAPANEPGFHSFDSPGITYAPSCAGDLGYGRPDYSSC